MAGVTQESDRHIAHRREVGASKADHPHAVIGREPRGDVFGLGGKLAGARKGSNRIRVSVPSTMN